MSIVLRPHQITAIQDVNRLRLAGYRNILCVLPTGSGKSLTLADYAKECYMQNKPCVIFAHRDVLISQLSESLCKTGIPHTFICSDKARRDITNNNLKLYGDSFYNELSPVIVSSNPTFAARLKGQRLPESFLNSIQLWIQDEAHHVTRESQLWGSCIAALPNALGLGFTATPLRGDKKGLGSHTDGVFDVMSVTTTMWDLIKAGMLSPYKVFTPPTSINLDGVNVTSGGDYNQKKLANRVDKREITGDAVEHYLRVSAGKPAITFCVNIDHARHVADQFNKAGIPSKAVSSKDPLAERTQAMIDFACGRILNLVNVDLLGEGYDSPSITTVIMLRPTKSYSLFKQQFGRALRTSKGKSHGILLDHVGNTQSIMAEHGLVHVHDDPEWTLERGTKRKKNDDGKQLAKCHTCPECAMFWVIDDHGHTCPDCGHDMTPKEMEAEHRQIQQKEGQLVELTVDAVDALIRERNKVDTPMETFANTVLSLPPVARHSALNNHAKRSHAQSVLRHTIQQWCATVGRDKGWSVDTVQREFSRTFGVHILKAQTLSAREAMELTAKVQNHENFRINNDFRENERKAW